MKRSMAFSLVYCCLLSACVYVSPRAEHIQILPAGDPSLAHCKTLGPVSATASVVGQLSYDDLATQAKNDLRDSAANTYGGQADAVVLSNMDKGLTKYTATGIAYKCDAAH